MSESLEQYFALLLNRLRQLDLYKVILFGSCVHGTWTEGSDIDLFVVLNTGGIPESYREKSNLYLQVSKVIRDVRQQIPIDLIVHTKTMYEKFIEMDSLFAKEIKTNSRVLYEKNSGTPE